MALSIVVRLREGRYDAAELRPTVAEWPPHPARVFCALVASANEQADWSALQWLEAAGEPQVWASPIPNVYPSRTVGFVVTNVTERDGGNLTWPGRSNGHKQRVGALPPDDHFALVWPDADPDDATLGRLVRLTRRVPYVGRSSASAELTAIADIVESRPTWTIYRPVPLGTPDAVELRVAYQGYLDALRGGHENGQRAWEFSRAIAYITGAVAEPESTSRPANVIAGPYSDMLIWGFPRNRVPVSGDRVLALTASLRGAVMSRVGDPMPPQVCGHGADGRPHVAYLGLPHVDREYADGHLLGVSVAIPAELTSEDRRRLLRNLLGGEGLTELDVPWGRPMPLSYEPERGTAWGLTPERWTAGRRGCRQWVTATPVMLDRYPDRGEDSARFVAHSLVTAGYPEPTRVEVVAALPVRGGIHRPRRTTLPEGRPRRPFVHCRAEFPTPVVGPVIAGSLRYLGVGLFIPEQGRDTDAG